MRGRSGPDKALAAVGAYLRVGAVQALTSVYSGPHRSTTHSDDQPVVTTPIIKSDTTPGLRPGAGALFSGGEGHLAGKPALVL